MITKQQLAEATRLNPLSSYAAIIKRGHPKKVEEKDIKESNHIATIEARKKKGEAIGIVDAFCGNR